MPFDPDVLARIDLSLDRNADPKAMIGAPKFASRDLSQFGSDVDAYHQLIFDLAVQQYISTELVLRGSAVKKLFVDGGFGKNTIYMNLLAALFQGMEVYASSVPQATAIGAALAIHDAWNAQNIPSEIVRLKSFKPQVTLGGGL